MYDLRFLGLREDCLVDGQQADNQSGRGDVGCACSMLHHCVIAVPIFMHPYLCFSHRVVGGYEPQAALVSERILPQENQPPLVHLSSIRGACYEIAFDIGAFDVGLGFGERL